MSPEHQDDMGMDILRLIEDAVGVILEYEDFGILRKWLLGHIRGYIPLDSPFSQMPAAEIEMMACGLLRDIWNVVPLPGKGFLPSPIPKPKRNEPCLCGSGKKFKQCCARLPEMPPLPSEVVWSFVIEQLDDLQVAEVVRNKKVSLDLIAVLIEKYLEEGDPEEAIVLLEPLFFPSIMDSSELAGLLLDGLCDAYGAMADHEGKEALLEHVIATASKSPLRSAAHQRSAAAALDQGDTAAAWLHFKAGMQDAPGSVGLSILEAQILLFEKRFSEAADRARFWIAKLKKNRRYDYGPLVERLQEVVDDPEGATATLLGAAILPDLFPELMETVQERPLPQYEYRAIEPIDADSEEGLKAEILSRLPAKLPDGVDGEAMVTKLLAEMQGGAPDQNDEAAEDDFTLVPSGTISAAETRWRDIFPLEKPFSIQWLPFECGEVWSPERTPEWTAFLRENPEALDSLDILDDFATAILALPGGMDQEEEKTLLVPILRRARRIVMESLPSNVVLDWRSVPNRPAIRPAARLALLKLDRGQEDAEFYALVEESLRINPNDNFGLRGYFMNHLVRMGRNWEALEMLARYPDDTQADIPYGSVLVLYRMGDKSRAADQFQLAFEQLPKVAKALVQSSMKQPEMNPHGIQIGGSDQAWLYQETMRDEWRKTRGILTWMKRLMQANAKRTGVWVRPRS
ncbi:MAG: SEC-C domain-containing protein [Pseudodesulfovibrio sp.]|nr:SEC-C domain-containing protein [Pseudodesulfovibrio sp.]